MYYLRGAALCVEAPFNRVYVLEGGKGSRPGFLGLFHSDILWDVKTSQWVLGSLKVRMCVAVCVCVCVVVVDICMFIYSFSCVIG